MSAEPRILPLRGVNAGAGRGLADLRAQLEGLGGTRVRMVLQSGKAVFCAPVEVEVEVAGPRIAQALAARLPFAPEALVCRPVAFAAILAASPFAEADPRRVQIGFLARPRATRRRSRPLQPRTSALSSPTQPSPCTPPPASAARAAPPGPSAGWACR